MIAEDSPPEAAFVGAALPEAPSWPADDEAVHLRTHRNVFIVSVVVVLASALLHVTQDGQGLALTSGAGPLPGMCLTRSIAHVDCPGCGITRSFVATAHGDLVRAFRLHRLGPPLFLLLLLQIPLRAYALVRRIGRPVGPESILGGRPVALIIIAALVANWVVNVATGAAFH